ncbi:MAG: hypothetical protein H7039_00370 [Bryobacteraceae bacterium]|nr:hypothetical protein [Bryobacteraceae bacterium]
MKHYSLENWVDYLRGVSDPAREPMMKEHLASGCTQCRRHLELLQAVSQSACEIAVPDAWLQRASSIFPRVSPPAAKSPITRLVAALTFDSFAMPVQAGVRTAQSEVHRLTFTSEDVTLELMGEAGPDVNTMAVTGQISSLSGSQPSSPYRIRLLQRKTVLQQITANVFGEFQVNLPIQTGLSMAVVDETTGRETAVPLDLFVTHLTRSGNSKSHD